MIDPKIFSSPVRFELDSVLEEKRDRLAIDIYLSDMKRRGRNLPETIWSCAGGTYLERACEILGAEINPNRFDMGDPESFYWDVKFGDLKFEVKRSKKGNEWFSFYGHRVHTLRNYYHLLDYVLVGDWTQQGKTVTVEWFLLAKSKTFFDHVRESRFNEGQLYYNHHNPDAILL